MYARRCFATTGPSMRLSFTCNSKMMGQEISTSKGEFRLLVEASKPVKEIQIVRNEVQVDTVSIGSQKVDHRWTAKRQMSGEFWYCRVLFEDGHVAWSSPIWMV